MNVCQHFVTAGIKVGDFEIKFGGINTTRYFSGMKESVKIDTSIVEKARKYVKKSKQTIGGFFEFSANLILAGEIEVAEWQRKADKWDKLRDKIGEFYHEEEGESN